MPAKAHGYCAPILHAPEHVLDLVTPLIQGGVVLDLHLAVLFGGDSWGYTCINQCVTEQVGIIAPIHQQDCGRQHGRQQLR